MADKIDISSWNRKQHFELFKNYSDPYFNMTANLDCTNLLAFCSTNRLSLFLCYLYLTVKAANEIKEFRYRFSGDEVYCYDAVNIGSILLKEDNTFIFTYLDYKKNFTEFYKHAQEIIAKDKNKTELIPSDNNDNVIHTSVIPWVSFTSFKHARNNEFKDSIPKIVFGKTFDENGKIKIPVSVEVHHAMMDGFHVGQFYNLLQSYFDECAGILE